MRAWGWPYRTQSANAIADASNRQIAESSAEYLGRSPLMAARRAAYDARRGINAAAWADQADYPDRTRFLAKRRVPPCLMLTGSRSAAVAVAFAAILATSPGIAHAAKSTECTKGGICYCVNDELKATIATKVESFRQTIAEQRKAGKAIGYLSVPLDVCRRGQFRRQQGGGGTGQGSGRKAVRRSLRLRPQSGRQGGRPAAWQQRRRLHADVDVCCWKAPTASANSTSSISRGRKTSRATSASTAATTWASWTPISTSASRRSDGVLPRPSRAASPRPAFRNYYALRASADGQPRRARGRRTGRGRCSRNSRRPPASRSTSCASRSGEALARVIAEKNNPRVDVLFGGPVETFAAGINEGVFEPYKPPAFAKLPPRFRQADGQWTAIADDPLVFMTNDKFLKENNLKAPASWDDLLAPPYKNMLQMADARTSGTAVTRIFSILEVERPRREQGVRLHEEAAPQRAALHQERRRRHAAGRTRARPAAASSSSSTRSTPRRRATT